MATYRQSAPIHHSPRAMPAALPTHLAGPAIELLHIGQGVGRVHRRLGQPHSELLGQVAAGAAGVGGVIAGAGAGAGGAAEGGEGDGGVGSCTPCQLQLYKQAGSTRGVDGPGRPPRPLLFRPPVPHPSQQPGRPPACSPHLLTHDTSKSSRSVSYFLLFASSRVTTSFWEHCSLVSGACKPRQAGRGL